MSNNREIEKQIMVYSDHSIARNNKEKTSDTQTNADIFPKHCVIQKKSETEERKYLVSFIWSSRIGTIILS